MVVQIRDTCVIPNPKKYFNDRRTVNWSQDWGTQKSVQFAFLPFTCPKDNSGGFVAVEVAKLGEFQKLCHEKPGDDNDWTNFETSYEFTVNDQFKYGQNNEQTFRFLVFQNPD